MKKYIIFVSICLLILAGFIFEGQARIAPAASSAVNVMMEKQLDLGDAKVTPLPQPIIDKYLELNKTRRPGDGRFDPNFYKKYLDMGGIAVMASDKVQDAAFYEAKYLASHMLANRNDILDAMAKRNTRLVIIAFEEEVSEVPEYYIADPNRARRQNQRVRGYGGDTLTSFGEENLLTYPGDRYRSENIMIHEYGHCIDGNLRRMDPNWGSELDSIFKDARSRGLWDNTYSASNAAEYWAEGVQAYFDCCARSRTGQPDSVHNQVGNRKDLIEYDPNLCKFIDKTLGPQEWRYTRYDVRHPEGPVETRGVGTSRRGNSSAASARGRGMDANSMGRRGRRGTVNSNRPVGVTNTSAVNQLQFPYFEEIEKLMSSPPSEASAARAERNLAMDVNSAGARRERAMDANSAGRQGRRGTGDPNRARARRGMQRAPNTSTDSLPRGVVISPIPQEIFNSYDFNDQKSIAYYKKMICAQGVPITCSGKVSDAALIRANELFNMLLAGRPDVVKDMVARRTRLLIIGANELVSDVPDYYIADPVRAAYQNERVRGYGGNTTSFGEENVLCLPIDRYDEESIMIHEFGGHCIDSSLSRIDPNFRPRLNRLFNEAIARGQYKLTYAGTNASEYWAEAVQEYFDGNRANNWNHNFVRTREQLQEYDPNLAKLVKEMFNLSPVQDWRYQPLHKQPLVTTPPEDIKLDKFYTKYLYCRSLPIIGSKNASDDAMYQTNEYIRRMLTFRHDILKAMIDQGLQFIVLGDNEKITDLPEFKGTNITGRIYFKFTKENSRFVVGKEYILTPDKIGENLVVREFAKAIPLLVGSRPFDPNFARQQKQQYELYGVVRVDENFNNKLNELYKSAIAKGLWKGTPAAASMADYFAEGTQSWFDCNGKCVDTSKRAINTRDELQKYDPELASFLQDTYKHMIHEQADWRAPFAVKEKIEAKDYIEKLRSRTKSLESFQCRLEYMFEQPVFETKTLQKGEMFYLKEGKKSFLRINFTSRKEDTGKEEKFQDEYIFDGTYLTRIDYQVKEVKHYQQVKEGEPVDAFDLIAKNFPIVGFSKIEELEKNYNITAEQDSKQKNFVVLNLSPKPDSKNKDYKSISLWMDTSLELPSKIVAKNSDDDIYTISFFDPKVNQKIDKKVFEYKVPKGFTEVTEKLEK